MIGLLAVLCYILRSLWKVFKIFNGLFSEASEETLRKDTYDTLPRSMSEITLRSSENDKVTKIGQRPQDDEVSSAAASSSQKEGQKGQKSSLSSLKKNSLVSLGLRSGDYTTQFDEEEDGLDDGLEALPGAFKRPTSAYKLARYMHSTLFEKSNFCPKIQF